MDLYSLLACPLCKVALERGAEHLTCPRCAQRYPIINGVPVIFPDGSVPAIEHEAELSLREGYNPWIERLVLQSLPPGAVALDMGAGNMALSLPNVIRMDVTLTPYVDLVADAHHLPFLPASLDFIFSLAVIEHLHQPFHAAAEMYGALRPGGYVYGECNFVFPYHGYPHHYFGATQQGIERIFARFRRLRASVATYQMPSFAIRTVLGAYLHNLGHHPDVADVHELIHNLIDQPLSRYDRYFSEEGALRVAAGVFFFGVKSPDQSSAVIPGPVLAAWQADPALQQHFPDPLNLGVSDNLMRWAQHEGRERDPAIEAWFAQHAVFVKQPAAQVQVLEAFMQLPAAEPAFGHIPDEGRAVSLPARLREQARTLDERAAYIDRLERALAAKEQQITQLESLLRRIENGRLMRLLAWLGRGMSKVSSTRTPSP